jgi:hypothetical protein
VLQNATPEKVETMPITNWTSTIIDGKEYLVIDVAKFRIPMDWDPSSSMFIAVAAPDGGLGSFPGLVQGDAGATPVIETAINFTALASGDTTPDSASWTLTGTDTYKLNLALHNGAPGDTTVFNLVDADDLAGNPVAGRIIAVTSASNNYFLTLTGPPTSGGYTLSYNGLPTSSIAYNATAATIQTALALLSGIGTVTVATTGTTGKFTVTISNTASTLTVGTSTLVGGSVATVKTSGYEYVAPKVGDEYWPASILSTPSGNSAYTMCQVTIPGQPWAWRPQVSGWSVVTGTGADVQVDLVARLNDQAAGNVMGRGRGKIGQNADGSSTVLVSGPPSGSAASYNVVAANTLATIYFRAERQSGSATFTTVGSASQFSVRVCPVP